MRLSLSRRLIVLALLLSLGIGALFARAILTIRDDEWNYARTTNSNLVQALEKSVARTLDSLDRSMVGMAAAINRPDVMALAPDLRALVLFDHSLRSPEVAAVSVSDAHGNIVLRGNGALPGQVNIAAKDYFVAHSSGAQEGLYIGKPQSTHLSEEFALPLSRAYFDRHGAFAGVVVVAVRLSYFNDLLRALDLGPQSGANLFRSDGLVLARYPYKGADVGRSIAGTPNMLQLQASTRGTFIGTATLDGVRRLYSFQHVGAYPLIVNTAQATDTILADWGRNAWLLGSFALVLMAACVGLSVLFVRELGQRQRVSAQLQRAEHDVRTILDNLPSMVSYWDCDQCNRFANQAYQHWFGVTAEALRNKHISAVLGAVAYAHTEPYIERALQGQRQLFERTMRDAQGVERFTIVSYVPDMDSALPPGAAAVRGVFVQITDITERKRMENELFEEKELMRLTLQSIGDAVLCTDANACVTYINPVAERMTGWRAFAAAGQHIDKVAPLCVAGSGASDASPLCQALAHARTVGPTPGVVLQRADGQQFDVEESASPITDRHGQVTGAVMVLHDVTESVAMAARLARLAHYDALTDLPNRVLLQDRAAQALALARRAGQQVAVLYLDLDGFKQINDTLGHEVGDLLLIEFAQRLGAVVRQSDSVCRQGGDEFVVLLPGLESVEQACVVARKILAICAQSLQVHECALRIGVSGGIAMFPQHGETFEELARNADEAMYAAKRAGRMQFRLFVGEGMAPQRVADAA
ncbi:diguanylate cyclase domain-containing protein [Simplicispira psychrophila]|uniref:diguanylate cyclase domain-containing protein n=1 Tax=Simplicispira psychrophila TaxID=80882 RepID=UPI000483BEAF|nr:diguanylate cyclase [Simplicispira psychrophila]